MTDKARIKLTDEISIEIVDPHNVLPVFANLVTELQVVGDVLHLSLASIVVDGEPPVARKAQICARLRISGNTVRFMAILSLTNPPIGCAAQRIRCGATFTYDCESE